MHRPQSGPTHFSTKVELARTHIGASLQKQRGGRHDFVVDASASWPGVPGEFNQIRTTGRPKRDACGSSNEDRGSDP